MLFEKLPENEKLLIEQYIDTYACDGKAPRTATLEHILRIWDAEKRNLYEILGNEFIISKNISYEKDEEELTSEYGRMAYSDNSPTQIFRQNYFKKINDLKIDYSVYDGLGRLMWYENIIPNRYEGEAFSIPLPNGKKYVVQNGTKVMRALAKISSAFGIEGFEEFRLAHSQLLNDKTIKGELCLSIHPLDYMTMSDNDCGWESCMSWENDGEYKQGTVEMMNSPCVVVGYLTSSSSYKFGCDINDEWNSKKWRCLFIVDKDFIINIKGYPYENSNLVKASIIELAKLAGWGEIEPLKYEYYEKYTEYRYKKMPCSIGGRAVAIDFCTQAMYNDFGNGHYIALNPHETKDIIEFHYNYSGMS